MSVAAHAAPEGEIRYEIAEGDTLYAFAKEYLVDFNAMNAVLKLNGIRNPRRLRIGQVIMIPRSLLRYESIDLSVVAFSGLVSVTANGRKLEPQVGLSLSEGDEITTGRNGFISIAGARSSSITIPTNSRARIIDARRYVLDGEIDVQVRLLEGRGEIRAPKLKGQERFRIGTPVTVTAVRGTEFRVAYEPETGRSLTEVIEGTVGVAMDESETTAEASFGVSATGAALGSPEALLPVADFIDGGTIQTAETVEFAIDPVPGAVGYRTQVSYDASFIEMFEESVDDDTSVEFSGLADGRYFVRSRGISESGLEGNSKVYSFRRKRLGAAAGVEPSPFADAFKFGWRSDGEGSVVHAFQLWRTEDPGKLLVDEVAVQGKAIYVSNLVPGSYKWRIAAMQVDEQEFIKVWGPTQELEVTE